MEERIIKDSVDIVAACRQLHSAIDRLDHAAAGSLAISRNDLRCLNLLEHGSVTPTYIATALNLTTGSVTALIDRLETKGLVERMRDPNDRRGILVAATPKVFQNLGAIYSLFANELRLTIGKYSETDRALAIRHVLDLAQTCLSVVDRIEG
ncbi:MarR family winged helix-turn-helix transcriptional regulator [Chamaesiphon sp.]|uniref:MarR family winged helix-turn-helix transcriptional regulator n=1 Tax=Chamaesiphon sp. TaxID=2814140 RepID=UPI003593E9F7